MANQQFDERQVIWSGSKLTTVAGTDPVNIQHASNAPIRVDAIYVVNFDSIAHTILLGQDFGNPIGPFAVVTLPAAVLGTPSIVEVIATSFGGQQACILPQGTDLMGQLVEAVTDDATPVFVTFFGGTL